MSERLEGFDNLPELQCNYCGVVFKGNHDCNYDILKDRVEELEEKLKHQTDHRLSVENNNLKRENQRYREAIEKTLDSMSGYDLFKYGDDLEKALENDSHDD